MAKTKVDAFPAAVDSTKVGKCPVITCSGGSGDYVDVLEYRVWLRNVRTGATTGFMPFATYEEAKTFFDGRKKGVEPPLVLVSCKVDQWNNAEGRPCPPDMIHGDVFFTERSIESLPKKQKVKRKTHKQMVTDIVNTLNKADADSGSDVRATSPKYGL